MVRWFLSPKIQQAAENAFYIPIQRGLRFIESQAGHRSRYIWAHSRQSQKISPGGGDLPAVNFPNCFCGFLKIPGSCIVTQAGPRLEHFMRGGLG